MPTNAAYLGYVLLMRQAETKAASFQKTAHPSTSVLFMGFYLSLVNLISTLNTPLPS